MFVTTLVFSLNFGKARLDRVFCVFHKSASPLQSYPAMVLLAWHAPGLVIFVPGHHRTRLMTEELAEQVVIRHRKRLGRKVKKITIDMDPTDDPTYGQQQLTFFNSHYANWCYLPVAGFLQFNAAGQVMNRISICSATCCVPAMFTPAMALSPYCDASLGSYAGISPASPFRLALMGDTPRRKYSSTLKMKASGMSLRWQKTLY